ncbi:hypothetical protein BJL95_11095 [Methylomonas sp. LWB]|nr:hypothetical protein BJL95_11095 [Methylomonas sp. LWB]
MKHGWVKQVKDWPYSTFHRWVKRGVYPLNWAGTDGDLYEFEQYKVMRRNACWLLRLTVLKMYLRD